MLHATVASSLPASGATHSVVGHFSDDVSDDVRELFVVKQNNVELWRIPAGRDHNSDDADLKFVSGAQLNAPPLSVAVCRPPGFTVDIIVLCFDDFHLSIVRFDALHMRLQTLALVQLDDREVVHDTTPLPPLVRADPGGRFLAVLSRRRHLFLIPLLGAVRATEEGSSLLVSTAKRSADTPLATTTTTTTATAVKTPTAPTDDWGDEDDYDEAPPAATAAAAPESTETTNAVAQSSHEYAAELKSKCAVEPGNDDGAVLLRVGSIAMFTLDTAIKGTVRYVRDVQFIASAGEPIMALLCERQPTWAGRVKLVQWRTGAVETNMLSSSVAWLQLSAAATATPKLLLIGEVDEVPYNVTHMVPVGPSGQIPSGVVCFGLNTVMHVTTKRGYGAYFNDGGREECEASKSGAVSFGRAVWCDAQLDRATALFRVNLSFAGCAAAALSGSISNMNSSTMAPMVLAVSEGDGVVAALHFLAEGQSVQSVRVSVLGVGCDCAGVTPLRGGLVFLSSVYGDSRLVAMDPSCTDAARRFRVLDTIPAIGAMADADVVDSAGVDTPPMSDPAAASPYAEHLQSATLEPSPLAVRGGPLDLAVCAGRAAGGALFVCRQSVRHSVARRERVNAVSSFLLEPPQKQKQQQNQTVGKRPRDGEGGGEVGKETEQVTHALLVLTGAAFTIVLAVRGESMQQLRRSEFFPSARTVFAASLSWLGVLFQLTEREGRIISADGRALHQRFPLTAERDTAGRRNAKAAAILPEVELLLVLLNDGTLLRIALRTLQSVPRREVFATGVTSFAYWSAHRSLLICTTNGDLEVRQLETRSLDAVFRRFSVLPTHAMAVTTDSSLAATETGKNEDVKKKEREGEKGNEEKSPPPPPQQQQQQQQPEMKKGLTPAPLVTHAELAELPDTSTSDVSMVSTALIVILETGEMAVYQLFDADAIGPLRLIKTFYHLLDTKAEREVIETIEVKKQRLQRERTLIANDTQLMRHCSRRIVLFDGMSGNRGAYVCGQHPLFLFWDRQTERLVAYRHWAPGPVRGFTPFRSRLMGKGGFIYCCEGFVDFACMDTYCQPNGNGWLTRRVHLGSTPHFVVYHPPANSCFVITSHKEPFRPQKAPFDVQLKIHYNEDDGGVQGVTTEAPVCNIPPVAVNSGIRIPMADRYDVRLVSASTWTCTDTLPLEENEQVLGAQMIEIQREKGAQGPTTAPVCVVSTAFPLGEDVTCRGRILLLATKWVNNERRILCFHSEGLNGPATAVTGMRNHIVVAIGGTIKLFRYNWETRKLVVGALLYAGVYVTKMSAFRHYLIYGDLYRSCAMARFNEENHTLTVLGKDRNSMSIVNCDMMYHDRAFGILTSDDQRNIVVMGYTPRVQESDPGQPAKVLESVLSLDGEYRLPSGCLVKSIRLHSPGSNASVTLYVTNYGEIGFIIPIGEQANRTALWVTRRLQTDLPHVAGLTPRMFLGLNQDSPRNSLRAKDMLVSAQVLNEFFLLDVPSRAAIASAAYTQLERITNVVALVYEESNIL